MRDRTTGEIIDIDMRSGDVEIVARNPSGLSANALPDYWLESRPDGSWWILRRKEEGSADCVLCVIPASVVAAAQASRTPLVLEAK